MLAAREMNRLVTNTNAFNTSQFQSAETSQTGFVGTQMLIYIYLKTLYNRLGGAVN